MNDKYLQIDAIDAHNQVIWIFFVSWETFLLYSYVFASLKKKQRSPYEFQIQQFQHLNVGNRFEIMLFYTSRHIFSSVTWKYIIKQEKHR